MTTQVDLFDDAVPVVRRGDFDLFEGEPGDEGGPARRAHDECRIVVDLILTRVDRDAVASELRAMCGRSAGAIDYLRRSVAVRRVAMAASALQRGASPIVCLHWLALRVGVPPTSLGRPIERAFVSLVRAVPPGRHA